MGWGAGPERQAAANLDKRGRKNRESQSECVRGRGGGGIPVTKKWKLAGVVTAKQDRERARAGSCRDLLAFKKLGLYPCE